MAKEPKRRKAYSAAIAEIIEAARFKMCSVRIPEHSPAILWMSALACSQQLTVRALPRAHCARLSWKPGGASSIPPVTKQNPLQHAVFWLRRCSLAFMISLISPAARISKMLPCASAGCCATSCTA